MFVNNLATIESLLNGFCYSIEILLLACGLPQIVIGLKSEGLRGVPRITLGASLILIGLLLPSLVDHTLESKAEARMVNHVVKQPKSN